MYTFEARAVRAIRRGERFLVSLPSRMRANPDEFSDYQKIGKRVIYEEVYNRPGQYSKVGKRDVYKSGHALAVRYRGRFPVYVRRDGGLLVVQI